MAVTDWAYSHYYCGNSAKWDISKNYVKKTKRFEHLQNIKNNIKI